ncbi:MAG: helix-turn-helix domain-containing protein [Kiloniellaceae bacterium]
MQTVAVTTTPEAGALLVTVKGAAQALGVSPTSIWRLTKKGNLEVRKIGGRTLITMESIRRVAEHGAA